MSGRKRATFIVTVDLDPVPGWGNDPDDWRRMLEHYLTSAAPHYNPAVIDAEALADDEALTDAVAARVFGEPTRMDDLDTTADIIRALAAALTERGDSHA